MSGQDPHSALADRCGGPRIPPGQRFRGWRRRTGIEPADDAKRRPPVLKTGHHAYSAAGQRPVLAVCPGQTLHRHTHRYTCRHPESCTGVPRNVPHTAAGRRMRPNAAGLSNTDGMRRMIRIWLAWQSPCRCAARAPGQTGWLRPSSAHLRVVGPGHLVVGEGVRAVAGDGVVPAEDPADLVGDVGVRRALARQRGHVRLAG